MPKLVFNNYISTKDVYSKINIEYSNELMKGSFYLWKFLRKKPQKIAMVSPW